MGIHYNKADFITYGRPSLFLDFANKKSLTDRISGNNLITFTRTSTGTYVGSDGLIKSAAVNEARFDHNPVTSESLGLLIEESRTNSVTTSNVITSSLISAYGTALNLISSGVPPSPKGENIYEIPSSAEYRIIGTNGNSFGGNSGASTTWTYSIFVYPLSGISSVNLNNHFGGATTYNLNTLTITSTGGYTGTIQRFSNGWWRLSYTRTYSTSTELGLTIPGNPGYYFSSAQIEQGAFPTSYIPTTGSQVTRNADSASITGTNLTSFYNQSQGTLFCRFRNFGYGDAYHAGGGGVSFDNSQFQRNMISLNMRRDGPYYRNGALVIFNDTTFASSPTTSGPANNINDTVNYYNFVGSFSASRRAFTYNGITPGVDTASIVMPTISRFLINPNSNYVYDPFTGYISRISYYPSQLTETQLESLTR